MNSIFDYLTDLKSKYDEGGKHLNLIAFVHEEDDYDRWALIISGDGLDNSKKTFDEVYEYLLLSMNGNLPNMVRSIYIYEADSKIITDLTSYLSNFKNSDPAIMKQINQFGINDGFFILG
jgi:hypothetical protein